MKWKGRAKSSNVEDRRGRGVGGAAIGGLGGFLGPIIFGYLLTATGIWSSSWIFILLFSTVCLVWMHYTVTKIMNEKQLALAKVIDRK